MTRPQRPKSRYHSVLFEKDTPFRPKKIRVKQKTVRRSKHREIYDIDMDD